MYWLLLFIPLAASIGLARLAAPDTLGATVPMVMGAVVLLGICWRAFERLLWLRYRTKHEHTVAAKHTCLLLVTLLLLQMVFVLLRV